MEVIVMMNSVRIHTIWWKQTLSNNCSQSASMYEHSQSMHKLWHPDVNVKKQLEDLLLPPPAKGVVHAHTPQAGGAVVPWYSKYFWLKNSIKDHCLRIIIIQISSWFTRMDFECGDILVKWWGFAFAIVLNFRSTHLTPQPAGTVKQVLSTRLDMGGCWVSNTLYSSILLTLQY